MIITQYEESIKKSNVQAIPDDCWLLTVKKGSVVLFHGSSLGLYLSLLHTLCQGDNNTPSTFFQIVQEVCTASSPYLLINLEKNKNSPQDLNKAFDLWPGRFFFLVAISHSFLMKTNRSILMKNFDIGIFHDLCH